MYKIREFKRNSNLFCIYLSKIMTLLSKLNQKRLKVWKIVVKNTKTTISEFTLSLPVKTAFHKVYYNILPIL